MYTPQVCGSYTQLLVHNSDEDQQKLSGLESLMETTKHLLVGVV